MKLSIGKLANSPILTVALSLCRRAKEEGDAKVWVKERLTTRRRQKKDAHANKESVTPEVTASIATKACTVQGEQDTFGEGGSGRTERAVEVNLITAIRMLMERRGADAGDENANTREVHTVTTVSRARVAHVT